MSEPYPLPKNAAHIWISGDQVMVGFPPTLGQTAHTVPFPASVKGLKALLVVLRNRAKGTSFAKAGEPTRYALERALHNDKRYNDLLRAIQPSASDLDRLLEDI